MVRKVVHGAQHVEKKESCIEYVTTREPTRLESSNIFIIFTARKRSLRRLCFHRCLSVHMGEVCPIACWDAHPPGRSPLRSACWDMVNKRAVRIPLECILVIDMVGVVILRVDPETLVILIT